MTDDNILWSEPDFALVENESEKVKGLNVLFWILNTFGG
jgi:hypothetical protein